MLHRYRYLPVHVLLLAFAARLEGLVDGYCPLPLAVAERER